MKYCSIIAGILLASPQAGYAKLSHPAVVLTQRAEAEAPDSPRIDVLGFQMQADNAGVAWSSSRLFRTHNDGRNWIDITPVVALHPNATIVTSFFLNDQAGWIFYAPSQFDPDQTATDIWFTANDGASWEQVGTSALPRGAGFSVTFADRDHGWALIKIPTSSNFSAGRLFRTADGGRSWMELPRPPAAGKVSFKSINDGSLLGGPGGNTLWVTHSAGEEWSQYVLPITVQSNDMLEITPPSFLPGGVVIGVVVWHDAGSRGEGYVLELGDGQAAARAIATTVLESSNGTAHALAATPDALLLTGPGSLTARPANGSAQTPRIIQDSSGAWTDTTVVDNRGWALVHIGGCRKGKDDCFQRAGVASLQLEDGTYRDITPAPGEARAQSLTLLEISPDNVTQSTHRGFDKCSVASTTEMQEWRNGSPYLAVNVYVGGENRSCGQSLLNSSWVSQVFAQGWSLIPTWVGPQSPSVDCAGNTCCNCSKFSSTSSTAAQQGITEANSAANALSGLGLSAPSIVYYDLEKYNVQSNAETAFINSWVQQLHQLGYKAGLYIHWTNAAWGFDSIANPPDSVWIARWYYGSDGNGSSVTPPDPNHIPGVPDFLFSNRRIWQYYGNSTEYYNGATLNIDEDIANGLVATSGSTSATPTVTLTTRGASSTNVTVDQSVTVSGTLLVGGATVDHAGISVSFPSLTNVGVSSNTYNSSQGAVSTSSITTGGTQTYIDDYPSHLLAEADWSSVPNGASKTFNLTVTPKITGTFKVRIRGWVTTNGYSNAWRDPSSGTLDQQGYPVYEYLVNVSAAASAPSISSPTFASVTTSTATLGGNVTSDGGATITGRGVVYSVTATNSNPLPGGAGVTKLSASGTTGIFSVNATSLVASTGYSFKAYATNSAGTSYTSVSTFTTQAAVAAPSIGSPTFSSVTSSTATLGGNVTSDGGATITERGVVYSATSGNSNPVIGGTGVSKAIASGTTGVFTVNVTGLLPFTGYSFKAYAMNSAGTSYSAVNTFSTTQSGGGGSELIANGGFEDAPATGNTAASWYVSATAGNNLIIKNGAYPHNGANYASMGGSDNSDDLIAQLVTIPTAGTTRLTAWFDIVTSEQLGGPVFDRLDVSVWDGSTGNWLTDLAVFTNNDASLSNNVFGRYFQISPLDLSSFRGMTVWVGFEVITDSSLPTTFIVDDVSLTTTGGAPTAPPNVVASATSATTIQVTWSAASGTGITYNVYRCASLTSCVQRVSGLSSTAYTDNATAGTAYLYKVRAASGGVESTDSNTDLATAISFTDSSLTGQRIRSAHLTELRSAVTAVRALAGLSSASFTDATLSATVVVKRLHVTELRAALDAARSALGLPAVSYTDPSLTAGVTKIKGAHILDLRGGVQ